MHATDYMAEGRGICNVPRAYPPVRRLEENKQVHKIYLWDEFYALIGVSIADRALSLCNSKPQDKTCILPTMAPKETPDWLRLQRKIFSRWCNQKLSLSRSIFIKDIVTELDTGEVLCALVSTLHFLKTAVHAQLLKG